MSTKVKFVVSDHEEQGLMLKAAQAVQGAHLPTEKVSASDVLKLEKKDKHLYVCCQFSGEAFDHLVQVKCRIVGPQCVISCLELQVAVPNVAHPINNLAMQDVVVSCSSIEKSKREIVHELVQWMGGRVSRDFTEMVTHLIVGEVGSKKYHVAANLKKPIMLPDWVEAAWKESQDKHFSGMSEDFLRKYRCPAFKGCIICVTGLDASHKQDVKKRADEHGGHYTGELKYNECTHLIVGISRGPKFEFARKWKIHTVSLQWFYESIEAGYCLDEQLYSVLSQDQPTSTPVKDEKNHPRLSTAISNISNISAINMSTVPGVDDTAMTEPNITMDTSHLPQPPPPPADLQILDKLDLTSYQADMFLDGCKIFLSGFSGQHLEKLRKIVNAGGGTRFNQLNENVSHVVMGNRMDEHIGQLKAMSNRPTVVSVHWLIECIKQGKQVCDGDYLIKDVVNEAGNENEITFKLPANKEPKKASRMSIRKKSNDTTEEEDILSQYMPNATTGGGADNDVTLIEEDKQSRRESSGGDRSLEEDDDETQIEEEDAVEEEEEVEEGDGEGIFAGKKFVVLGFTPEHEQQLCEMIPKQAGVVLKLTTRSIPDYAVVPIFGWTVNVTVHEIVTNSWLQMCIELDSLLDPTSNDLFTPIPLMKDAMPLRDCVLSISQYCYIERDCLLHIAELLGALCQEYFVRKAVNNLEANTHLLLRDPEGTKYQAAKKWKVPAVTKDWLLGCARTGRRLPEKEYLVDLVPNETSVPPPESRQETVSKEDPKEDNNSKSGPASEKPREEKLPEPKDRLKNETSEVKVEKTEQENVQLPAAEAKSKSDSIIPKESGKNLEIAKAVTPANPVVNKNIQGVKGQTPGRENTPSRLLRPGFKPSFDLEEAVAALDSPGMGTGFKGHRRKSSLPLDEFFHQNISNALQIRLGSSAMPGDGEDDAEDNVFKEEEPAPGILDGVVICVCKKLSRKQGDYNSIAIAMGAEYQWTYDDKCTHFIFQGRANDTTKEFRLARSQGKVVVSPHWLLACQEENKRLDEKNYPHTFNPKLSLSVVASSSQTPVRSTPLRARSMAATHLAATPLATTSLAPPPIPQEENANDGLQADTLSDEELLRAVEAGEQGKTPVGDGEKAPLKPDLQKQLDDIMSSSTMNLRGGRRRSRRPGNSISNAGETGSGSDVTTSGRKSSRLRSKRASEKVQQAESSKDIGLHNEASQSVPITWDDPTSRREKEKIMARIRRSSTSPADPMEVEDNAQPLEEPVTEEPKGASKTSTSAANKPDANDSPPSPTPKAPPIRLPVAKPAVAPQPREENQEEVQEEVTTKQSAVPPKFLFSGMGQQEKIDYSALIEQLGGEVKDAQYFDASCTHIIVGNPTRNEKYLAALATGKWILHKSYLEACREAKGYVEEEPHEWGHRTDLSKLNETGKKMALAATRWRTKIQEQEKAGANAGAFEGWTALLLVDKNKEMCFKRLLEAGGAKVLAVRPPFINHLDASHAFFDLHKVKMDAQKVSLEELVRSGVMCLKPEYIADFLVRDPTPDPDNYIISEAKPILVRLAEEAGPGGASSKRRASNMALTPRSKRSRHK